MVAFEIFHFELNHVYSLTESFQLGRVPLKFKRLNHISVEAICVQDPLVDQTWVLSLTRFLDII
jgi:hypothetical protein